MQKNDTNKDEKVEITSDEVEEVFGEEGDISSQIEEKINKLKKKLDVCETEKKSYLDGWLRIKADVANEKKHEVAKFDRIKSRVREEFLENLLPALDSFESAMKGEAWQKVDGVWRTGVEYIYSQMISGLKSSGIERFGSVGDKFDENLHETDLMVSGDENVDRKISAVLRSGYKIGENVARVARVTIE